MAVVNQIGTQATMDGITAENELDISITRVDKIDAPLLVIGLGGSGAEAVKTIKSTFARRYNLPKDVNGNEIPVPEKTAYLVLDSDGSSQGNLDGHEFKNISVPGLVAILTPGKRSTSMWENAWLHKDLNAVSVGAGAGTYRQAARMMLSRNYTDVRSSIVSKLKSISHIRQGDTTRNDLINIVICAGISGGTGSGTFLDIAQIVRHVMATEPTLNGRNYRITGYLVMPDVSVQVLEAGNPLNNTFKSNAYAALKELDFWMGYGTKHNTVYEAQYSENVRIPWGRPFSACAFMSGTDFAGHAMANSKEVLYTTVAENLLHYLASEIDDNANGVDSQYTYLSYEDNIKAAVDALEKPLPLNYCYRAVGAYTKRIPKKKVMQYEGYLLFKTFMPQRDKTDHLYAQNQLIERGVYRQDAVAICGDLENNHYRTFAGIVNLPYFCGVDIGNASQVEALRNMNPPPHRCENVGNAPWLTSVLRPGAYKAANEYLDTAWNNFVKYAKGQIKSSEIGPFAFLAYLQKDGNTLLNGMNAICSHWISLLNNCKGAIETSRKACNESKPNFDRPPMMNSRRALQTYKDHLYTFYDNLRRVEMLNAYVDAISKLIKRVEAYRDQSLNQLCSALDRMHKEFESAQPAVLTHDGSELYSVSSIRDTLDESFYAQNMNQTITREFLEKLCDGSFSCDENADPESGGLTFVYGRQSMRGLRTALSAILGSCFDNVNNSSMDTLLVQKVGDNPTAQNREMDELAASLLSGAMPLFSVDPVMHANSKATYTYMSVPQNASKYFEHYTENLSNVTPKRSSLTDHIYCLTTYDGLPACAYSQLADLEKTYSTALQKSETSMGLHLVWNGKSDDPVERNWSLLPSPRPFYFFAGDGDAGAKLKMQEAITTLDRAIAAGMIEIDDNTELPKYKLRQKVRGNLPLSSQAIKDGVDAIDKLCDPNTNAPLTDAQKLPHLLLYRDDVSSEEVLCGVSPSCIAPYLGLENSLINPFSPEIQTNPDSLKLAWENYHKLSHALVAAMLQQDPFILQALRNQLEGMEYMQSRIDAIQAQQHAWEPRIAYAQESAEMMIYGLITIYRGNIEHNLASTPEALITEALLKDDIRDVVSLVKAAAYLADLPEQNPTRLQLEHELRIRKDDTKQKLQAHLLDDAACKELYDPAVKLDANIDDAMHEVANELRILGADIDKLNSIKQMLTSMQVTAKRFMRDYKPENM